MSKEQNISGEKPVKAPKETKSPKPKSSAEFDELVSSMPKPKLTKLIVKNFRSIGPEGVSIDLDDIVILVGPNNAGKSSILKAYDLIMKDGSKQAVMTYKDFPNEIYNAENPPEIEIQMIVYTEGVGKKWLKNLGNNQFLIREKWVWNQQGQPTRTGWDYEKGDDGGWSEDSYPFGWASKANLRRPEPHTVLAFDSPDTQATEIKSLLLTALTQSISSMKKDEEGKTPYDKIMEQLRNLQTDVIKESEKEIGTINSEISEMISKVFPSYIIDFKPEPEVYDKGLNLFTKDSNLLMGPKHGYQSNITHQGSGARRTLLWTALKYLSEKKQPKLEDGKPARPHILLIDEPEICLHPNAIREARKVLYDLPKQGNWQVMATTHSPVFIDFSEDNTTIVRVEKNDKGIVKGTTIYRPDVAKLDEDDKKNLKLLNLCDPYVAEFFFGGKVIIVEGDTEYSAFNYLINENPTKFKDIHIIRARGKATIVSLIKILNQFGSDYAVLHDSDRPKEKDGSAGKAWGNNKNILAEVNKKSSTSNVRLLASIPNFEEAYFGEEAKKDKPYNAWTIIQNDTDKHDKVEKLLEALSDHTKDVPENCIQWSDISDLEKQF